jgi:thiamine pyrophosphokinase
VLRRFARKSNILVNPLHTASLFAGSTILFTCTEPFLVRFSRSMSEPHTLGSHHDKSHIEKSNNITITFTSPRKTKDDTQQIKSILIILNMPIRKERSPSFEQLWQFSQHRICADGGANRLYHYNKAYIPNRIRGDLDSLEAHVEEYYKAKDVIVEKDPCQDTNDLDKALQVCVELVATEENGNIKGRSKHSTQSPRIYIYGAFGGRFDQEMASFAALYKWAKHFHWQMYLYGEETCAFLIPADKPCEIELAFHDEKKQDTASETIKTETVLVGEGPTCGLVPLGCRCDSITTSGLKWDLDGTVPLEFGGLVSTSNRIMKEKVSISTSHPVIFTAELQCYKEV